MLGERADFELRKTPISHRTRILARSRSVRLTASSAGEALHVPAAGLAAAGSPYLRECTLSSVRLRFPQRGLPSHISYVSEAGRATLFVYRVGHAVPSAFVSDAVPLCSVCCLTSSPAFPRRLDRSAAPVIMSARPRLPPRWTRSLARFPARGRFPRTCVPAPRIGFGRCALLLPLFRIGCEYVPPPPRAPFSPNTYPAWGAEHPRAGARRAP